MNEKNELLNKLHRLEQEHRDLDEILHSITRKTNCKFFTNTKTQKKKIRILKDRITYLRR